MQINYSKEAGRLTAAPNERLDSSTAPEFEKDMAIRLEDVSELVLDMTGVEYVSSAGLRVILKLQKIMCKRGGMKLIGVNETVMDILELTGFSDILKIE